MSALPARMLEPPAELTEAQRDLIRSYFEAHPDGGYKHACRAANIRATKDQAKQLVDSDPELAEWRLTKLGLDEGSLFKRLGEMAQNPEHRDQFRAVTFGLTALHGHGAQRVEVTGQVEHGGIVHVEHERRLTLADVAAFANRIDGPESGARRQLPGPRELLAEPPTG